MPNNGMNRTRALEKELVEVNAKSAQLLKDKKTFQRLGFSLDHLHCELRELDKRRKTLLAELPDQAATTVSRLPVLITLLRR